MRRHIKYLSYILRHKWFVLLASLRIGAPIWRAILHDLSKFRPSEWGSHARTFYNHDGSSKPYVETDPFMASWNHHQKRNQHHWQYWLLYCDDGNVIPQLIPAGCILEMIADWMGTGRAIHGVWETYTWYNKNRETMQFHDEVRAEIEAFLMKLHDMHLIQ